MALHTVESKNLQQITLWPDATDVDAIEEPIDQQWQDLDRLLVEFWTSRSIRTMVAYEVGVGGEDFRDSAPRLLPELSRRGLVDMVECAS